MKTKDKENPSPFLQAAITLDDEMSQLDRIGRAIGRIKTNTEKGLDRAHKLFAEFDECRRRIGTGMSQLGHTLEQARNQIETSTNFVSERALEVQQQNGQAEQLLERFRKLGSMVNELTKSASELGQIFATDGEDIDETMSQARLGDLIAKLDVLVTDTTCLQEDATKANLKTLEHSADSLRQSLQVTKKRLMTFATQSSSSSLLH